MDGEERLALSENKGKEEKSEEKSISADLIRGHINTIILRALYDGDKYGYEIIAEIERKSHGQYSLKQPSLYSALKRLETQGYVTSYWGGSVGGGRRKYFSLTDEGKIISEQNQSEWEYSRTVIDSLISDKDFDFSNPAPTAVNMRVLRSSTSRVPSRSESGEDDFGEYDFEGYEAEERERILEEHTRAQEDLQAQRSALEEERARIESDMAAREEALREERERQDALFAERERAFEAERAQLEALRNQQNENIARISEEEKLSREQLEEKERIFAESANRQQEELLAREQEINEKYNECMAQLNERDEQLRRIREEHLNELAAQEQRIIAEQEKIFQARERQLIHQNYIALVNTPPSPVDPEGPAEYGYFTTPIAEETQTEEETISSEPPPAEEEYRTVVHRLYSNSVRTEYDEAEKPNTQRAQSLGKLDFYDIEALAARDGIKITTTGGGQKIQENSDRLFHKGKALFLSAIVVFVICLIEGSVALAVMEKFALPLFYPYFIWGTGLALLLIMGVAYANHYGERAIRRTGPVIINAVVAYSLLVICTLIIALAVNIDFASVQLATFVVVPVIYFLNVLFFAVTYYILVHAAKNQ